MRRRTLLRVVGALALVLGFQPLLSPVSPASAAPVSVNYTCRSSVFGMDTIDGPQAISLDVTVPTAVGDAETYNLPVSVTGSVRNFPFEVTGAELTVQMSLKLYKQ